MALKTFELFVCASFTKSGKGPFYAITPYDASKYDTDGMTKLVLTHTLELEVPDLDPVAETVAALEKAIQKERVDSQVRLNTLQGQINDLLAISHTTEA